MSRTNTTDKMYMAKAVALALKARGKTSPNPIVGAVIVKNDRLIGSGYHKRCGGPHAEAMALNKAGRRAKDATLYVTMEPCNHHGRTPPCIERVLKSGLKRVVVGMKDPNPLTNGKSLAKMKRAGIKVTLNVLRDECTAINEPFIKYIKRKLPFVTAKCAQTLDGKIATRTGHSQWITSDKTRQYTRRLRNDFDAIMVGTNTALKDNPKLTAASKSKRIKKVVIDSALRVPMTAVLFKTARPQDCFVMTTRQANKKKIKAFEAKGVNIIICPEYHGRVNLTWAFKKLAQADVRTLLIEGGGTLIGGALKQKLVDKMQIYIAPKIVGDQQALSSIHGLGITHVGRALRLKSINIKSIGEDMVLEGYVHGNC